MRHVFGQLPMTWLSPIALGPGAAFVEQRSSTITCLRRSNAHSSPAIMTVGDGECIHCGNINTLS